MLTLLVRQEELGARAWTSGARVSSLVPQAAGDVRSRQVSGVDAAAPAVTRLPESARVRRVAPS